MMNRILLSIGLIFSVIPLFAQEPVDKVMYRFTYKTDCVRDTTLRDSIGNYQYAHDEMALDVGTKVSKFYSMLEVKYDEWLDYTIKHGGEPTKDHPEPKGGSVLWTSYYNYPEGKHTTLYCELNDLRRIEDPITPIAWTIAGDTCSILGYPCTRAETDYMGRHWTVWYTDDIPISQGPWQLGQLPGMILKAADSRRQWIFTAIGMEQLDEKENICLDKKWKKCELMPKKKFYDWRRKTTPDDMINALNASGVKVTFSTEDGGEYPPEEYRKNFMSPTPFNPIDLSE